MVCDSLCLGEEKIAGMFFIGTPALALEERPRPIPGDIIRQWP
jgi:hypothetical protein